MKKLNVLHSEDGLAKPVLILIIVLAVLVVGGVGYVIGQNKAESDTQAKINEQTQSLQQQLDDAKAEAAPKVEDGQDSIEALQTQNAELDATVAEQAQKIADLEKQLEEANDTTPTPPTN